MKTNATHFKNHLGEYLLKAHQEPVIIDKSGKPSAVLMSYSHYEMLSLMEDLYWGMKAQVAAKEGYLGPEESERRLREYAEKAGITIHDNARSEEKTD